MKQKKTLALYLRSSMEQAMGSRNKKNLDESDTIANQRKLLIGYAMEKGLADYQIVEYVDDGHSGVNFNRPGFQKLMKDAEDGLINAIIVKDLSRMGRDYIGVGNYMEQIFPGMGIRIISVNDQWDSDEHIGETLELDASFRTLLYDMYSRDLSRKRKSANAVRNKNGIYTILHAPYGYLKSPTDKHSLVIDPDTAPIVKRIYEMFLSGVKIPEIAKILTNEQIVSPQKRNELCYGHRKKANLVDANIWPESTIRKILQNEMYTGTVILNRYKTEYGKESEMTDKSEWMYFPDRHEAIVSKENFSRVQAMFVRTRRKEEPVKIKERSQFYCGHCGGRMAITTREEKIYLCRHALECPDAVCAEIKLRKDVLDKTIVELVNLQARLFLEWTDKRVQALEDTQELEDKIEMLAKEANQYRQNRIKLYERYREGQLSREDFAEQKRRCLQSEEECIAKQEQLEMVIRKRQEEGKRLEGQKEAVKECVLMESYDYEIMGRVIDRIEIFNDERIRIHWRFMDEFPECDVLKEEKKTLPDKRKKAAVYTSQLFFRETENELCSTPYLGKNYCISQLGLKEDEVDYFSDIRDESKLFYKADYMKMIAAARNGQYKYIVIGSFRDLYLSARELHDFLYWKLPNLPCRLISINDGYDSVEVEENGDTLAKDMIYKKYSPLRKGDIMKLRALERKEGKRVAKKPIKPVCGILFGFYEKEDGCYQDAAIVDTVKMIYQMALDGTHRAEIARKLNQQKIPTSAAFCEMHNNKRYRETTHLWDGEKVWLVTKNRKYTDDCRYRELCVSLGRHCERTPIISEQDFKRLEEMWQYRKKKRGPRKKNPKKDEE